MGRKKKNIHYLYKTTCSVTGRYYVGMHSTNDLEDGYLGSGRRLRYSIRKYGEESHVKEILSFYDSRELLIEAEKEIVNENLLLDINSMNMCQGGNGGATRGVGWKHNDEVKKKISEFHKGKVLSEETKNKISEKVSKSLIGNKRAVGNTNWVGRKHKKASLEKMRDNHPLTKKVEMYSLEGILLKTFNSLHEAEKVTGNLRKHISRCCRGLAKTCGKHKWKFKNDE